MEHPGPLKQSMIEGKCPWQVMAELYSQTKITPELASILAKETGTTTRFWLNLQERFDAGTKETSNG